MERRNFIKNSLGMIGAASLVAACNVKIKPSIGGKVLGASAKTGHLVRDKTFNVPTEFEYQDIVIIGGGVSGLSAAYHLQKNNKEHTITLFELEKSVGGNAAQGSNQYSKFPFGAHYIPIINNELTELLDFFHEKGIISSFNDQGLPIYKEEYLCSDPQERLYINGLWQEGLIPQNGLTKEELTQVKNFLIQMDTFRKAKGNDGLDAFSIPVNRSSKDEGYTQLDQITMHSWLLKHGFTAPALLWYVNYCTLDDFGATLEEVSAWAGIHYFASRKGKAVNANHGDVITWQQGNGFLVEKLKESLQDITIQNEAVVVAVERVDQKVRVVYYDMLTHQIKGIFCNQCIMAIPQFVANRLLKDELRINLTKENLSYSAWMVANITVNNKLTERNGSPLSWDNVIYKGKGLGYVNANNQKLEQVSTYRNYSYYYPIIAEDDLKAREIAFTNTHSDWVNIILEDLKIVNPDLESNCSNIDIMIWGHGMIKPKQDYIFGAVRKTLATSVDDRIHFAHTDIAGVSIFEEAFYQGLEAANKVLKNI